MLQCRFFSSGLRAQTVTSTIKQYVNDPVKLLVVPITNKQSFVYFKYSHDMLNKDSRLIRYETKISQKAAQIWNKMKNSDKTLNKRIVAMVTNLLDQIPWTENSLQTIPSESYILKRIEHDSKLNVTFNEYVRAKNDVSTTSLKPKPIHVYYPDTVLSEAKILAQLRQLAQAGRDHHKKYAMLCAIGIPITLPLVLIPIVPNIPGFYLTYRLYCNLKAYYGAKHLQSLITNEDQNFEFINLDQYSDILQNVKPRDHTGKEELLLTAPDLERVMDSLEIREISSDLHKAIR